MEKAERTMPLNEVLEGAELAAVRYWTLEDGRVRIEVERMDVSYPCVLVHSGKVARAHFESDEYLEESLELLDFALGTEGFKPDGEGAWTTVIHYTRTDTVRYRQRMYRVVVVPA